MSILKRCWPPGTLGLHGDVLEIVITVDDSVRRCAVITAPEPQPIEFNHVQYHSDVTPLRKDEIVWQVPTATAERSQER